MAAGDRWKRQAKLFEALSPFLPGPPEPGESAMAVAESTRAAAEGDQPRWWAPLARAWDAFAGAAIGFQPEVATADSTLAMRFEGSGVVYEFDVRVMRSGLHVTSSSDFAGLTTLEIEVISDAHGSRVHRVTPNRLRDGLDIDLDFDPSEHAWGLRVREG